MPHLKLSHRLDSHLHSMAEGSQFETGLGTGSSNQPNTKNEKKRNQLNEKTQDEAEIGFSLFRDLDFDTGSANLDKTSFIELDRLVKLLAENPEIRIQLNGHTDDVGEEADNLDLSERRAKAVYDYLIDHKVAATRLRFKGYGESQPIDTNDTKEGRQNNRRTAFITF